MRLGLSASYYRLLSLYELAKQLDDTKSLMTQLAHWDAHVRRQCQSKDCLRSAYRDRLASLTKWIQLHSDPLPDHWSGTQEVSGCPNDATAHSRQIDSSQVQEAAGRLGACERLLVIATSAGLSALRAKYRLDRSFK